MQKDEEGCGKEKGCGGMHSFFLSLRLAYKMRFRKENDFLREEEEMEGAEEEIKEETREERDYSALAIDTTKELSKLLSIPPS